MAKAEALKCLAFHFPPPFAIEKYRVLSPARDFSSKGRMVILALIRSVGISKVNKYNCHALFTYKPSSIAFSPS
jgi:hypothetical protein